MAEGTGPSPPSVSRMADSDGRFARAFALGSREMAVWRRPRALAVREAGQVLAIKAPEDADTAVVELWNGEGALFASLGTHIPEAIVERARREFATTPMAPTFPAFSSVLGDATGHLWVEEYKLPRDNRRGTLWTVFDPEGQALGFVETPDGLEIDEIGEDYIRGWVQDELGVESVRLWPLERSW